MVNLPLTNAQLVKLIVGYFHTNVKFAYFGFNHPVYGDLVRYHDQYGTVTVHTGKLRAMTTEELLEVIACLEKKDTK